MDREHVIGGTFMYIKSSRIYTPEKCVDGILHIENGRFTEILDKNAPVNVDLDVGENRILPGIIDTHNHGTLGYGAMGFEGDIERELRGYLKGLASQGVTGVLPTTVDINGFGIIAKLSKEEVEGAKILGIHSEGPYLNRVGEKGVDTGHPDIDLDYIKKMVEEAEGTLKLVALAPELPFAKEAIVYLNNQGIRVSFAHSNMMYDEAKESFKWGITVSTHTANVMAGIHHRNMGGLGACLLDDELFNEVICDGKHVSNEMLEIMFRIKRDPFNKFMLVSDCSNLSGAPLGKFRMMEGFPDVNITEDGFCLSDTGRLCGSTMPVLKGIKNLVENVGISMKYAIKMASLNPAKVYGYTNKGTIEIGKDADFIVIDDYYDCLYTYTEGRLVYNREKEGNIFNQEFLKTHKVD